VAPSEPKTLYATADQPAIPSMCAATNTVAWIQFQCNPSAAFGGKSGIGTLSCSLLAVTVSSIICSFCHFHSSTKTGITDPSAAVVPSKW